MQDDVVPTAGVDWASETHVVSVVSSDGVELERFDVAHTRSGLANLARRLHRADVQRVAIERPDGPVVDVLLAGRFEVTVVPPRQVKALRSRYGSAGHKDDGRDAYVLADTLRTDGHRFRPLSPDSEATVALRAAVRARKDLVATRVRLCNQLRAHLDTVFPGAVGLFRDLDSAISLAFLRRFPSAAKGQWLSVRRLERWLRSQGYSGGKSAEVLFAHIESAPQGPTSSSSTVATLEQITLGYVTSLETIRDQISGLETRIDEQLRQHPDGPIFLSLPGVATLRAAALLAEIGDCRDRYPSADLLASAAGVAPSTRQSGKHHAVVFRWSASKPLRNAVTDFADGSRQVNPWAAHRYQTARAAGKRHPHAVRVLARSWIDVIWRCWHDRVPYDPQSHGALQALQPQPS